jgi:hypothetical protein
MLRGRESTAQNTGSLAVCRLTSLAENCSRFSSGTLKRESEPSPVF